MKSILVHEANEKLGFWGLSGESISNTNFPALLNTATNEGWTFKKTLNNAIKNENSQDVETLIR